MVDYKDYDKKSYHAGFQDGYAEAKEIFKRPQGEWVAISSMIDKDIHIICSNCKEEFIGKSTLGEWSKEYLFCHRCGAEMKGSDNE